MIKNEKVTPVIVTERNVLIEEIEKKTVVIFIEGDLCNELSDEIKKQVENAKFAGNFLKGLALVVGWLGTIVIPGVGWTIGGVALASLLGIGGISISSSKGEILSQYKLAYDKNGSKERFVLVYKSYSFEFHSLVDGNILTDSNKCPKCNKSYNKKQMLCEVCNGHIIKVSNNKALKKKI